MPTPGSAHTEREVSAMQAAFFQADRTVRTWMPGAVFCPDRAELLARRPWTLLALTAEGCRLFEKSAQICRAKTLILPGEGGASAARQCRAEQIVTYGSAPRDSLTVSSLGERTVLVCLQRRLICPDGRVLEAQERTVPRWSRDLEKTLAVTALRLLLDRDD